MLDNLIGLIRNSSHNRELVLGIDIPMHFSEISRDLSVNTGSAMYGLGIWSKSFVSITHFLDTNILNKLALALDKKASEI